MDAELRCYLALDALQLTMDPGETALDAVLRHLAAVDPLLRPYRYPQADGMSSAFTAWFSAWPRRNAHTEPGGYVAADTLNTFQAGYTARGERP